MTTAADIPGLTWRGNGQAALSGDLLGLYRDLDLGFRVLASRVSASEVEVPPLFPAAALQRIDYFASFPHLATFACVHEDTPDNLADFAKAPWDEDRGALQLGRLAPTADVLTPAACYHVYLDRIGQRLTGPVHVTLCARCFRREAYYQPLRRQWAFSMREIVCLGTPDEVKAFLADHKGVMSTLAEKLGLKAEFAHATDPFFNPGRNGKYLMQVVDPVKEELVFAGDLAIGSLNYHRSTFGEAFDISRDGEPVHTGCAAFGMERWLFALIETHGLTDARARVSAWLEEDQPLGGEASL
ncbi:MAG: aminoacyl--tRNA ligase-related protein [Candidatus Sericytochromatia bacterium]|nr:aminoacyl--tRNA ligase-related protein [Candidatus Sericytochromatia bacterium]